VAEKKEQLRALVKDVIANRNVDVIFEESDPCRLSIAQEEAFRHSPHIRWKNMNMTSQERLEAGIWEATLYRPSDLKFLDESNAVQIDHRILEDDIREDFFRDEMLKVATRIGAKSQGPASVVSHPFRDEAAKRMGTGHMRFSRFAPRDLASIAYNQAPRRDAISCSAPPRSCQ